MGELKESGMRGKTVNGTVLKSQGRWVGVVQIMDRTTVIGFGIFDSGGAFEVLLGKPWLIKSAAVHFYKNNTLQLTDDKGTIILQSHNKMQKKEETMTKKKDKPPEQKRTEETEGEEQTNTDGGDKQKKEDQATNDKQKWDRGGRLRRKAETRIEAVVMVGEKQEIVGKKEKKLKKDKDENEEIYAHLAKVISRREWKKEREMIGELK
ncbi:hypothetical protein SERLA73DRAFT_155523 [Serpula lacrymans var. lacrymans S7.3]|uniref:Uncharacterized protein n=2 Tax=Serpula lacrymans var. lacrymans TaxID=341189 RepID=F8QAL0_SERL3|nr:uncharacterized protein SERLADRAFT_411195 [Serpula lacrymans var. lacrymans S7.9]EGN94800.1 hypothetical protein SERLA73DRAFT_155523 [Serpula lacrymans var. lacrymans S7.3]EGO20299.1 hypothetical protein SERLADRAFT_411195 [Serpula lacrymans var. lacrymans S7.9]